MVRNTPASAEMLRYSSVWWYGKRSAPMMTLRMRWRVVSIPLVMVQRLLLSCMVGCLLWLLSTPALGLSREALYDQLISTAAQHYALDPALVKAVIKCESRFDPWAQSPRGAQGLMQLMPATAEEFAVEDPFEPAENLAAGAKYLRQLIDKYGGDLALSLAAYNAGPSTVDAAKGVPEIPETRDYVKAILEKVGIKRLDPPSIPMPKPIEN